MFDGKFFTWTGIDTAGPLDGVAGTTLGAPLSRGVPDPEGVPDADVEPEATGRWGWDCSRRDEAAPGLYGT